MKKKELLLLFTLVLFFLAACGRSPEAETWRMVELGFESVSDYAAGGGDRVRMDVEFVHDQSGDILIRPAFWDGDNVFRVRFAPTKAGKWTWRTTCADDASLDGKKGTLRCKEYAGELPVYRHGFIKAVPGVKHLMYADGTPFFYLGDTHWTMYTEEWDEPGPHAGKTGAQSHFRHIVDRRVEQGFTVYQSEPIGASFQLEDGRVDAEDIPGFQEADAYYRYIADAGLVHANAEFFFASSLSKALAADDASLEALSRYWVARFGAFPVLWTLAQEVDNDSYAEEWPHYFDLHSNPWVKIAGYIHAADAYGHPLSAHQENAVKTSVTGMGTEVEEGWGASAFLSEDVAREAGHNWWAAQWFPPLHETPDPGTVEDYWHSSRPAVNYEGRYCYLWTKDFGSRAQGWISFLSGFCGYGYGAIDIWYYQSTFDAAGPSNDEVDIISVEDKAMPWCVSLEFPSALQMRHLRSLLESFDWWNLAPVIPGDPTFRDDSGAAVCAHTPERYLLYFYAPNILTGCLAGLIPGASVEAGWYDPRTGAFRGRSNLTTRPDGSILLPEKPDSQDWVLVVDLK